MHGLNTPTVILISNKGQACKLILASCIPSPILEPALPMAPGGFGEALTAALDTMAFVTDSPTTGQLLTTVTNDTAKNVQQPMTTLVTMTTMSTTATTTSTTTATSTTALTIMTATTTTKPRMTEGTGASKAPGPTAMATTGGEISIASI